MRVVTPRQMSQIDKTAIEEYGIPGTVLMENAAIAVVNEASKILEEPCGKKIIVAAGKGNNGGDGFAVARHLLNLGADICVHLAGEREGISGDALINFTIIEKMGIGIHEIIKDTDIESFVQDLRQADLVIDALYGTGLKGAVRGIAAEVINSINRHAKKVISVDIPSGVDGETGVCKGEAINAECTVTFCLPKVGLLVPTGCEKAGRVIVADIGIPGAVLSKTDIKIETIDKDSVRRMLPLREKSSSKGNCGKVLIISGSQGMTGSGCLAASSALKSGAGLVYLAVPASLAPIYASSVLEPVLLPLEDEGNGYMAETADGILRDILPGKDIVAAGPGLSTRDGAKKLVSHLLKEAEQPLVLDADALNIIAEDKSLLTDIRCNAVLTPHPGEMARLAGTSIEQVQKNRMETARGFAQKWNVVVVLKGYRTLVASPDGRVYINLNGNPGMATAGSGDVLTGMIAGIAGQGLNALHAAAAGVYLHGLAGDLSAGKKGEYGMTASDIAVNIPEAIKKVRGR